MNICKIATSNPIDWSRIVVDESQDVCNFVSNGGVQSNGSLELCNTSLQICSEVFYDLTAKIGFKCNDDGMQSEICSIFGKLVKLSSVHADEDHYIAVYYRQH